MTADQQIAPALTAEEWASKSKADAGGVRFTLELGFVGVVPQITFDGVGPMLRYSDMPALMALANAALPDDDPRKITRADVETLRRHDDAILDRIADQLAALLPPDE